MSPPPNPQRIDPSARIGEGATIAKSATIEAGVVIYDGVIVGENTYVGPHAVLGHPISRFRDDHQDRDTRTVIGDDCVIRSHTVIYQGSVLDSRVSTGHGAVIREFSHFGQDSVFGVHSVCDGYVTMGRRCRLHGHVGLAQDTRLGDDVLMYPHATTLDTLHPPCRQEARGPTLEDRVVIGAGAFIFARLTIGHDAVVGCQATVMNNVPPGKVVVGNPAKVIMDAKDVPCQVVEGRRPYPFQLESPKG